MTKKLLAEGIGTFWLVLAGCGSAILAGDQIGTQGVALAFGLSVLTGAYAFGRISGGHFNPAVSLGLWAGGRFPVSQLPGYVLAQVIGGIAAAALLYFISGAQELLAAQGDIAGVFATNGYGTRSPEGYGLIPAFVIETVLTAVFVLVILRTIRDDAPPGFAPIAIGLTLTLIHLTSIPVTNTSVNPARSTAVALFVGGGATAQLWLFWAAPLLGAVMGAAVYRLISNEQ